MATGPAAASGSGPSGAKQRDWLDYADLSAKVLLPFAVLGATLLYNHLHDDSEKARVDRTACVDHQFELAKLSKDVEQARIDKMLEIIAEECRSAGKEAYHPIQEQVASRTKDVTSFAEVQRNRGLLPANKPVKSDAAAPAPIADSAAPATLRPRVYIQIQREDQRTGATALRALLNASRLDGKPILAPGVELPANPAARVAQTELRCAGDDCKAASELAAYIAAKLGRVTIPVRDIGGLYRGTTPRPGHYELWIGPEDILAPAQ